MPEPGYHNELSSGEKPEGDSAENQKKLDKKLEEYRVAVGKRFDRSGGSEQLIEEILSRPGWKIEFGVFANEPKVARMRQELLDCKNIIDKEEFIKRMVDLATPALRFRVEDLSGFEKIARDSREAITEGEQKRLSEVLYREYDYDKDKKTVKIHLAHSSTLGITEVKRSIKEGLENLAEFLRENKEIEIVQGTSYIFGKNPKLRKIIGFSNIRILEGDKKNDPENPIGQGTMTRDEFLAMWPMKN